MFEKYKKYIIYFGIFVAGMLFFYGATNMSTSTLRGSLLDSKATQTTSDTGIKVINDRIVEVTPEFMEKMKKRDDVEIIDMKDVRKKICEGGKITVNQIGGTGTVLLSGSDSNTLQESATIQETFYTKECAKAGSYILTVNVPKNLVLDAVMMGDITLRSPYAQNLEKGSGITYTVKYKQNTGTVSIATDSSQGSYVIYSGATALGNGKGAVSATHTLPVGTNYKIAFGEVSNFIKPADVSFDLRAGENKIYVGQYTKNQVSVDIKMDNPNGSYIIYKGSTVVDSGSNSTTKKLPASANPGTEYKITFNSIEGYITPAPINFNLITNENKTIDAKYSKIQGIAVVSTNNHRGAYTIYKADATIAGSGSGTNAKNHPLTASSSPGTLYKIVFEGIDGYITPADISFKLIAGDTKTIEGKYTEPNLGTLEVSPVSSSILSDIVIGGTKELLATQYTFTAKKDAYTVKKLTIINDNPADPNFDDPIYTNIISSVKIKYPDPNNAGAMKTVKGSLTAGKINFSGLDFYIPKDSSAVLKIYTDVASITVDKFNLSGKKFSLGLKESNSKTEFEAVGKNSLQYVYLDKSGDIKNSEKVPTYTVRKSKPIFEIEKQEKTAMPTSGDLFKFKVSANGGDVSLARLVFDVKATNFYASGSDIYNWSFENSSGPVKGVHIWGQGALKSDNKAVYLKDALSGSGLQDCNTGGTTNSIQEGLYKVIVTFDKEQKITVGKSETYAIKASIFEARTNDKLYVSLAGADELNEVNVSYNFDNDNGFGNTTQLVGNPSDYNSSLFSDASGYFGDKVSNFTKFRNIIWSDASGGDFASDTSGNAASGKHTYPIVVGNATSGAGSITASSGTLDWINGYELEVNKLGVYKFVK